jgi:hypothetical protein
VKIMLECDVATEPIMISIEVVYNVLDNWFVKIITE